VIIFKGCRFNGRAIGFLLLIVLSPSLAVSEIVTDGSLGAAISVTGPNYQINSSLGLIQGANLFHSFSDFNINTGESANFSGPASVANIFSRVTSVNASNIDGQLGSDISGANLYLINPNGIIFGDNATLNLSGSFYASTADYITLQDGGRFEVSQVSDVTLSNSPIAAFGFLDASIADIQVNKSNLQVIDGETLALIGGNINVLGDDTKSASNFSVLSNAELVATNGRIDLIAVASAGEVDIQNENPVLNNVTARGNVKFTNDAEISVRGNPGGKIFIRAGNLVIEDSALDAANTGNVDNSGRAVDIDLTGDFIMSLGSALKETAIQASSYSTGNPGDVFINADQLFMTDAVGTTTSIASRSFNSADSGDIYINTRNIILSGAQITTETSGTGKAGDIFITTKNISQDGTNNASFISSSSFGQGDAGNINITAQKYTATGGENGFVGVAAQVSNVATGNPATGNIVLNINEIELFNSAQISIARNVGAGNSGFINITSSSILISGQSQAGFSSGIFSDVFNSGSSGTGGNITINTGQLVVDQSGLIRSIAGYPSAANSGNIQINANSIQLKNAGIIASSSTGTGSSGLLNINTKTLDIMGSDQLNSSMFFNQSGVFTSIGAIAANAQDLNINASERITMSGGGIISADTFGTGNAGNINLVAPEINITGWNQLTNRASGITSGMRAFGTFPTGGSGGNINITGNDIIVSNRARVTAQNFNGASGNAGNVNISATNISVLDNANISAKSTSSGTGGNIDLRATNILKIHSSTVEATTTQSDGGDVTLMATKLVSLVNSNITTSVQGGTGSGGNIFIDPELLFINNTNIIANAFQGTGGNITLQADNMLISPDSNISASSALGVDGQLIINTANDDTGDQVEKIAASPTDGSIQFKQNCAAGKGLYSSFVIGTTTDSVFEQTGLIFSQFENLNSNQKLAKTSAYKSNHCS